MFTLNKARLLREKVKQITCWGHFYEEINYEDPKTMDYAIANLYGNFARCVKCGHETYMGRNCFIKHLENTGRLKK